MHKTVAILGRQPTLGIAELESIYGSDSVEPYGQQVCGLDMDACNVDFTRLGGSVRVGTILLEFPSINWKDIEKVLVDSAPAQASKVDGKLSFGISVYGLDISTKQIERTALTMKKSIKNSGKSVRMVPHRENPIGSATVLNNKLHKDGNWELMVISDGKTAYLAQTNFIQDIDAYSARDRERPMRDAKVGMLPPKLAQIIVNLTVAQADPAHGGVVLDPFCGTGVVMQEASLMYFDVYGTDIDPRMVDYTEKNFQWLRGNKGFRRFEVADATTFKWVPTPSFVACETFLGQPLSTLPPSDQLAKIMREANEVNHKFLQNIARQLKKGSRLCVAVPAWRGKHEFLHLSALDHLTEMGYNRLKFKHISNDDLIYHREGQVVGRELLVLIKK